MSSPKQMVAELDQAAKLVREAELERLRAVEAARWYVDAKRAARDWSEEKGEELQSAWENLKKVAAA